MKFGRGKDLLKSEMVIVCGRKMPNMCSLMKFPQWTRTPTRMMDFWIIVGFFRTIVCHVLYLPFLLLRREDQQVLVLLMQGRSLQQNFPLNGKKDMGMLLYVS